jgi:hypothetical protein
MNHDPMRTITTEMCDLLNEQTEWLKSSTELLIAQSREEVDGYAQRNDRLCQLGKELSELDWRPDSAADPARQCKSEADQCEPYNADAQLQTEYSMREHPEGSMISHSGKRPSLSDICAQVKHLGYAISRRIRLYGEEFEVVSDPFPEAGGIAVHVTTKKDSTIRVLQIPATVLRGARGQRPH